MTRGLPRQERQGGSQDSGQPWGPRTAEAACQVFTGLKEQNGPQELGKDPTDSEVRRATDSLWDS